MLWAVSNLKKHITTFDYLQKFFVGKPVKYIQPNIHNLLVVKDLGVSTPPR